ncbi:MAG: hypothetical protein ACI308_02455 [Muribaculaceae bacterium]
MLRALYEGAEAKVLTDEVGNAELKHCLNHASSMERIMLLGHGSDRGLFARNDDGSFRLFVGHQHAYYLRKNRGNIVGVWCHADLFARKEGLHGLFSGMIISELSEAQEYGIPTTASELSRENELLAARLAMLLNESELLRRIPARMLELDDAHTPLTEFNYKNFFYL